MWLVRKLTANFQGVCAVSAAGTERLAAAMAIADKAERLQWVLIPVDAAGYASRFGRLEGIEGIPPTRRIELLPYVATEVTARSHVDARNPFDDRLGARAGADLKVGLGPNLSLDATINPDFGQVEADPAVVNLTAFEQVFEERRPFFVEGNELLTGRGQSFIGRPTWFYSRRIGAPPRGLVQDDFVDSPTNTTITTAVTKSFYEGLFQFDKDLKVKNVLAENYPFATIEFHAPDLPVQVSLEAYTPLVPLDPAASGIPGAVLAYTITNTADQ